MAGSRFHKSEIHQSKISIIALPNLILSILLILHSNAAIEGVFSIIRKNNAEIRSSLGIDALNAMLIEKFKSCSA